MLSDLEPLSSSLTSPPSSARYLSSHRLYTSLALASATVSRPLLTIPCNFTKLPNSSSLLTVCKKVSHSKTKIVYQYQNKNSSSPPSIRWYVIKKCKLGFVFIDHHLKSAQECQTSNINLIIICEWNSELLHLHNKALIFSSKTAY